MKSQTTAVPKAFIGMDVHKKSWTVHLKTDLFDFKTVTMAADPESLQQYTQKHFPDHDVNCCYEGAVVVIGNFLKLIEAHQQAYNSQE